MASMSSRKGRWSSGIEKYVGGRVLRLWISGQGRDVRVDRVRRRVVIGQNGKRCFEGVEEGPGSGGWGVWWKWLL